MRSIVILAVIVFVVHFSAITVFGCSCASEDPLRQYCQAEAVVVLRVQSEQVVGSKRIYQVKVRRGLKGAQVELLKSIQKLTTYVDESLCGLSLQVGNKYLLQVYVEDGTAFYAGLCSLREDWTGNNGTLQAKLKGQKAKTICEETNF